MKAISLISIFLLSFLSIFSQEWTEDTSDDGKITLLYRLYDNADDKQVIEYKASTIANVDFEKCIRVMKNVSIHKNFSEEISESKQIKSISDTLGYIYYFFDFPWPLPNADCIQKVVFSRDGNKAKFICTAAPNAYKMGDVDRIQFYSITYILEKLPNGQIKFFVHSKMIPTVSAPAWLASSWFPEGATEPIENIFKEANKL